MGKRLEDLGIGTRSTDHDQAQRETLAEARSLKNFLDDLEEMSEDSRFDFAMDTIAGIHQTVEKTGRITDGQRRAINNIRESKER